MFRNIEYAETVAAKLKAAGIRFEIDKGKARMGGKIVAARERLIPYMLIMGDRDAAAGTVSVRLRDDRDLGAMPLDQFIELITGQVNSMSLDLVSN